MLRATVSGSFHRHMPAIYDAVGELRANGVEVLSPSDPQVVDNIGEFLFVASDRLRSIKLVQDRHFACIAESDFLLVVCPDGYTGASTSAEIGAAHASKVPVFATSPALDITLGEYVTRVPSIAEIVRRHVNRKRPVAPTNVLVDPSVIINRTHTELEALESVLLGHSGDSARDAEHAWARAKRQFASTFSLRN